MTAPWYLQHYGAVTKATAGDMRAVLAVVAGKTVSGLTGIWASITATSRWRTSSGSGNC